MQSSMSHKTTLPLLTACVVLLMMAQILPAAPGTNEQPARPAADSVVRKVQVDEFETLWRDKRNIVLDVRTKKEFEAGHIPGARNIDVNGPDFEQRLAALDKHKVYLVHCAAGVRSARACGKMSRLGFSKLFDLAPGFKAWEKAGKPVQK